jgi:hypothetical protein
VGASILGPVRRLGWFLVGATSAAGALVAAPRLYERLRAALGAGDPWTELEPEERHWGVLREAPPIETEPEPWVADAAPPVRAAPEREPDPEDTAVWRPAPPVAAVPVEEAPAEEAPAEAEVAEPQPEAVPEPVTAAEPYPEPVAEAERDQDDDTDELAFPPLTAAPPPDDSTASELRSRIQASRARLRRKARTAGDATDAEAADESDESDEPDEPDSSA